MWKNFLNFLDVFCSGKGRSLHLKRCCSAVAVNRTHEDPSSSTLTTRTRAQDYFF